MIRFSRFASLVLALGLVVGCTTAPQTTMLAPARTAITSLDGVRVYNQAPKHFQEIAIVEGRSLDELRAKAAAVGANGILRGGIVRKPGPVIGIGVGGGTYHYGQHGGAGFDTSAQFDVPTGSNVLEATAIYVPNR